MCRPGASAVQVPHSHQGLYISSGCKHAAAEESRELWGLARQGTPRSHPTWPSRKTTEPPWVGTLSRARLGLIPEHSLCSVISREDPAEEATYMVLDQASVEVVCAKEEKPGRPYNHHTLCGVQEELARSHTPLCALTPRIPMSTRYPFLSPETRHSNLSVSSLCGSLQNRRLCLFFVCLVRT